MMSLGLISRVLRDGLEGQARDTDAAQPEMVVCTAQRCHENKGLA